MPCICSIISCIGMLSVFKEKFLECIGSISKWNWTILTWMGVLLTWMGVLPTWMGVLPTWMGVLLTWMGVLLTWMGVLLTWMGVLLTWMGVLLKWNCSILKWNCSILKWDYSVLKQKAPDADGVYMRSFLNTMIRICDYVNDCTISYLASCVEVGRGCFEVVKNFCGLRPARQGNYDHCNRTFARRPRSVITHKDACIIYRGVLCKSFFLTLKSEST
jgi:hypothetical protein